MERITDEQVSELNDEMYRGGPVLTAKIVALVSPTMLRRLMDLNHVDPDLGAGVRGRRALAEACGTSLDLAAMVGDRLDIQAADYAAEKAWIDADMAYAVTLEIGLLLGYTANYGQRRIRQWANRYTAPEIAFGKLRSYADEALDRARNAAGMI